MKVLVKGNIIADGGIAWNSDNQIKANVKVSEDEEKSYDLVIYGDMCCNNLWVNKAIVHATGVIIANGKE